MKDFETLAISGSNQDEFGKSCTKVFRSMPPDERKRLLGIFENYFARYGLEGQFQRMNNRTVGQIFAEYQHEDVDPIASGQIEGVRYALYDPPKTSNEGEQQ